MPRRMLGTDVLDAALNRLIEVYEAGHTVVCSFSAGKDSGIVLELCILAATETGRLPVHVAMRDEEIMVPGTFEYAERVAERPEVDFRWLIAGQPILNCYNREFPYWWVFDPLEEDKWVRRPPDYAMRIVEQDIQAIVTPERFPVAEGKMLLDVVGLRTQESPNRLRGLFASGHWIATRANRRGATKARPIYDWTDGDVWKAILDNGWDYNRAYDTMARMGIARRNLRIAPPTMVAAGLVGLQVAARAWPRWFDLVAERLPGIRTAVQYGRVSVSPFRKPGETWQENFQRECIDEAPAWIAERCKAIADDVVEKHSGHSSMPFPEAKACPRCGVTGSWERLAKDLWSGDPFSLKNSKLKPVEPEFFRAGTGTWGGGTPTW